jgi:hypothetical protein
MAFGATITVTVNAVAKVLNRINQDNYGSEYYLRSSTDEFRMKIRHSKESPQADGRVFDRHNVELTHVVYATPTVPELKRIASSTFRVLSTDDLVAAGYLTAAFIDYVDGGTVQADLLTWQS